MAFNPIDLEKLARQAVNGMERIREVTNAAPVNPIPVLDDTSKRQNQIQERINKRRENISESIDNVVNRTSLNNAAVNYFDTTNNTRQAMINNRNAEKQFIKDMTANGYSKSEVKDFVKDFKNNNGNPVKGIANKKDIDKYIDPNYRMSKYEESNAKELVNDYFKPGSKAYKLLKMSSSNANQAAKIRNEMTEEERNEYDKMAALKNKTSGLASYTLGALNIVPFENTAMDKMSEALGGNPEYNYSSMKESAKTQNPLAYTAGDMTSKLAAYNVLGGALEEIPWLGQATNAVGTDMAFGNEIAGKAIGSILRGNIADLALDTLPTEIENYQNGMGAKDIAIDALKNEALNTVFNAFGELPSLAKDINAKRLLDAKNAEEAAYLKMVEDDIYKNTDNAVNAPARNDVDVDNIDWGRGGELPKVNEEPSAIAKEEIEKVLNDSDSTPGIQVYRGYNRSDNPLERNLAKEKTLSEILGKKIPGTVEPEMLPLEFYTESFEDATNYANHDKLFYDSLRDSARQEMGRHIMDGKIRMSDMTEAEQEAYMKNLMDSSYRILTGREPVFGGGHVETHTINPKKILDLTELGDVTNADSVYNFLSRELGIPSDSYFNGVFPDYENDFNTYMLLKNASGTNADWGSRFLNLMRDNGYDSVKYTEDGYNHYALLRDINDNIANAAKETPVEEVAEQVAKEVPAEEVAEQIAKNNPIDAHKQAQLDVILETNPALRDNVVWIRDLDDIKTFDEVWAEEPNIDPDFTDEMAQEAMRTGKIKVYSSHDINNGTFVTPSYMEALSYAGTPDNVKSAVVNLDDVAWIDSTQGQLAKTGSNIVDGVKNPTEEAVEQIVKNEDRIQAIKDNAERYQRDLSDDEIAYIQKLEDENYRLETGSEMSEADEMMLENNIKPAREMATEDVNPNEFANDIEETVAKEIPTVEETVAKEAEPIREEVPAEVPKAEVPETRESGLSQHIRGEGKMQMKDVPEEVVADFESNPQIHDVLKNKKTLEKAEDAYANSSDRYQTYRHMLEMYDPTAVPFGQMLAKDYSAQGQHEIAAQIYRDMAERLTKSGQFSQAAVLAMTKDDPLAAMHYAEKEINSINRAGKEKFGNKWKDFKLTDEEMKAFGDIKPGDEDAIKKMYEQIGKRMSKEYPSTMAEKILELRRVAMLLNPRTMLRNVFANIPTEKMRWVADRFDAVGENIAHLINPNFEVTQSVVGSGIKGRQLAKKALNSDEVQALIKGTPSKYEEGVKSFFMDNKQIFKGTALEKWLDDVSGKAFNTAAEVLNSSKRIDGGLQALNSKLYGKEGVQSTLETLRNTTYKLLDLGDSHFVKENFIERLGSYINAQGIKNVDDIPQEAIRTAWEEAMKATYKDNSWAVKSLSKIRGGFEEIPGVGKFVGQAAIPFLQAPGNIAARMVDYSPIGGGIGIKNIISGAKHNDLDLVRQGIDQFSKGATGSGMVYLGMKLRESGLITGDYSDDPDQKAQQKRDGFKPFALHIGDRYYAYDWAQPMAEPMIIGTLLQETIENSDKYDSEILKALGYEGTGAGRAVGALKEGSKASLNSWFNASPLQGLADLLGGNSTNDEKDIAQNIIDTTVGDFAGAFIPSAVNATAKTLDTTQRNTYDPTNKFKTFLNQQQAKLPGLSKNLPTQYDTWGNEIKYAEGFTIPGIDKEVSENVESGLQRYVIPGEYGIDRHDEIDDEINRLFEETGNNAVFAPKAGYKVGDVTLDNEQNSIYQQDMGQRNRDIAEEFINSDYYETLSDEDRAEMLKDMYNISRAITERDKFDKEISDNSSYKKAIEAYDKGGAVGLIDYYEDKQRNREAKDTMGTDSEWAMDLYNSGDKKRLNTYKDAQKIAKSYGFKSLSEEEFLQYEKYGADKLEQTLYYKESADKLGVSNNETYRMLVDNDVDPKYIKQAYKDITSTQYGVDEYDRPKYLGFDKTAVDIYYNYGEQGIQDYATIKSAGGDKDTYNAFRLYTSRQPNYSSQIPELNATQYMQQVDNIEQSYFKNNPDKDGKPNGQVSMTELLDYMTKNNFSQDLAQKYWNSFFDNGYTVSLTKNGKYHYTKPKTSKKK